MRIVFGRLGCSNIIYLSMSPYYLPTLRHFGSSSGLVFLTLLAHQLIRSFSAEDNQYLQLFLSVSAEVNQCFRFNAPQLQWRTVVAMTFAFAAPTVKGWIAARGSGAPSTSRAKGTGTSRWRSWRTNPTARSMRSTPTSTSTSCAATARSRA